MWFLIDATSSPRNHRFFDIYSKFNGIYWWFLVRNLPKTTLILADHECFVGNRCTKRNFVKTRDNGALLMNCPYLMIDFFKVLFLLLFLLTSFQKESSLSRSVIKPSVPWADLAVVRGNPTSVLKFCITFKEIRVKLIVSI